MEEQPFEHTRSTSGVAVSSSLFLFRKRQPARPRLARRLLLGGGTCDESVGPGEAGGRQLQAALASPVVKEGEWAAFTVLPTPPPTFSPPTLQGTQLSRGFLARGCFSGRLGEGCWVETPRGFPEPNCTLTQ